MDCVARSTRRVVRLLALLTGFLVGVVPAAAEAHAAAPASFTFGAAGDHGSNGNAAAVLRRIGAQRPAFFLSLGDLSYDTITPAAWCQFVKTNLNAGAGRPAGDAFGESYPFALVEGNHERHTFDQFVAPTCLPDRMGAVVPSIGTYGRRYHVDVPAAAPLARFIAIDPGIHSGWNVGSPAYQWLSDTIDGAREAGIRWVVVADHVNHITSGNNVAEMGSHVFDLLVDKRVDLILQSHDHTYQRSKQLATGQGCHIVPAGVTDADCIVDDGADGVYRRGSGSVLLIVGTAGRTNYPIDPADPDAGYFARARGSEGPGGSIYGFSSVTVSDTRLDVSFSSAAGAAFSDSFTIGPK